MLAYILVNTAKGKEQEVYEKLLEVRGSQGAHLIFGEWDVIFKVRVENSEDLATLILDNIRSIDGVTLTSTLIIAK